MKMLLTRGQTLHFPSQDSEGIFRVLKQHAAFGFEFWKYLTAAPRLLVRDEGVGPTATMSGDFQGSVFYAESHTNPQLEGFPAAGLIFLNSYVTTGTFNLASRALSPGPILIQSRS